MGLTPGTKLGPYEVLAPLGAGGMGEVYRAKDMRLERTVAIKVLPTHLSTNTDLKQRFEREAKAISQLQHAHICTLFDVGSQNGTDFLVMEYLEGETVADRLKRGPMPPAQLTKMAMELAEALEKAHHAGLIHRDIKPGNIMLTKSGAKLLDFGLAKPMTTQPAVVSGSGPAAPLLSGALTQSSPAAALTSVGTVVGTVQYMSPEQIGGQEADARSDIFCLGAVLYEAAAGRRAFEGKTPSQVVGAILANNPPPASSLQSTVPAAFDRVIATCLAKDPADRFESAHDLKLQLEWVRDFGTGQAPDSQPADPKRRAITLAAAALVGMLVFWAASSLISSRHSAAVFRAEVSPPPGLSFDSIGDTAGVPVLSPQGDKIAFVAKGSDNIQTLWVRSLDSLNPLKLEGTEGAAHPFWSPDGRSIGFFNQTKLNRISATGGPVTSLADASNARGATWGKNGVIVYTTDFRAGLMQIGENGGTPSPATALDTTKHTTHRWPFFMPDGIHFIYYATNHGGGRTQDNGIYFASLDGKENRMILASDSAAEYASGYLIYHSQTALVAQPFDPSTGELSETGTPIVSNVRYDAGVWRTVFSVSKNGILCYQPGTATTAGTQLQWYEPSGKPLNKVGERANQTDLNLSPDGKKLALVVGDPFWELWVLDLERGGRTRLTFNEGTVREPSWTADGRSVVYRVSSSQGGNRFEIRSKAANGSGPQQTLSDQPFFYTYPSISPDGKYLNYISARGQKMMTVWAMPLTGERTPFRVVTLPSQEASIVHYRISPDSKWIAYESDETGRNEVYLAPYPKGEGKWQVSFTGGAYSVWRRDGKELYYHDFNDQTYAISVQQHGAELELGSPRNLFKVNVYGNGFPYDVSADGRRFLMNKSEEAMAAPLYLVVNWTAELKK